MAEKKDQKKQPTKSYTAKKKTAPETKSAARKRIEEEQRLARMKKEQYRTIWRQTVPYLLIVAAILLIICFFTGRSEDPGLVTGFIYNLMTGLFSISALVIPIFLIFAGVSELLDKGDDIIGIRTIFAMVSSVLFSVLFELFSPNGSYNVIEMFKRGTQIKGGGVVGGLIGQTFLVCFKSAASYVIVIALLLLGIMLTLGLTPKKVFQFARQKIHEAKERAAIEDEYEDEPEDDYIPEDEGYLPEPPPVPVIPEGKKKKPKFDTDVPVEDALIPEETAPTAEETPEERRARIERERYEEAIRNAKKKKTKEELDAENAVFDDGDIPFGDGFEEIPPEKPPVAPIDTDILDLVADSFLDEGDGDGDSLTVEREPVSEVVPEAKQVPIDIPKPEYKYPPIDLLSEGTTTVKAQNVREELHDNAAKLVSVLASFNVRTKIVGVSRGPTITRYELLPEPGTRVKSISNLVDDIALNLATSGVRIEAPIPGKAAVGIEVPNKTAETVYLRSLIADKSFSEHKSKISSALGKDVAGSVVLMDIQKMPHLLIAGATGMGKSVCINSLLVSLLYKASPEDVKLILIDPKKVEFSIYNGLPHLLVPVVSDPKKAAGSLTWAVNEMERRFGLIESVGVREIDGYNKITENDPEMEHMPRIVIVIDELADLMSTAPDDVETSIARLAAKARAAGMHLVIGTQRPSVDVITGVIKANIPSRIAFTVASQVDSRTIIDRSGAENLIGRGDMLYNPVGAAKPQRVQGAFVSDSEVDAVVSFIKANNCQNGAEYSDEVMKEIEAQAALCGAKKGSSAGGGLPVGDGGDGGDPLIDQALEVAFESGKISTSLLQRRLSVGYGRAAKIIDKMEELGYVSAPEGQKPRQLLITKQDYMEMKLRKEDEE